MSHHQKGPCYICFLVLLLIGGLNWGLVGLGMLIGNDLNVLNMLLGSWPTAEAILYLLIGITAIWKLVMLLMHCGGKGCCKDEDKDSECCK